MPLQIDTDRFGTDLALPITADESIRHTATGDLPSASGRANLRRAIRRRILTNPGELVHRPDFGCGLAQFLERPMTPSWRARMASVVRSNILLDPRIADASVSVSLGVPGAETRSGAVTIEVSYRPADDAGADQFTVEYDQG